jgi:hypothetical protein
MSDRQEPNFSSFVLRRSPTVAWISDENRVVVLDLSARKVGAPLALSASAAAVWNALDGEQDVGEIIKSVATASGAPAHEIALDVIGFLEMLVRTGLIVRAS